MVKTKGDGGALSLEQAEKWRERRKQDAQQGKIARVEGTFKPPCFGLDTFGEREKLEVSVRTASLSRLRDRKVDLLPLWHNDPVPKELHEHHGRSGDMLMHA